MKSTSSTVVMRPTTLKQRLKRRSIANTLATSVYVCVGTALIWILFVTGLENAALVTPVAIGVFLASVLLNIVLSYKLKYTREYEEGLLVLTVLFDVILFSLLLGIGGSFTWFWIFVLEFFGVLLPLGVMGGIVSIGVFGILCLTVFAAVTFDIIHMANDALTIVGFSFAATFLVACIFASID